MRLTLRNLLAYMDDLLDPESARVIGQKTEESEFASGLLHRIRDVSRRTKLGAPEVIDPKAALDPNTVAEYLDNTLPTDRVTDFEKVCLDSDIELAEVAACHQVLTLVLGEPAEVRPESRVRMYRLPETAASQTYVGSDDSKAGESRRLDVPAISPVKHRQPAVPEYLLAARRRRRLYYGTATTAAILCIALYLGATDGLSRLLGGGAAPSDPDNQVVQMPRQPEESGSAGEPLIPAGAPFADSSPSTPEVPPESTDALAVVPAAANVAVEPPSPEMAVPADNVEAQAAADSVVSVAPTPTPSPTTDAAPELPVPTTLVEPVAAPPGPAPDPGQMAAVTVPAGLPDDREPMVPDVVVQARDIGQLIKPEEMALVTDGAGEPFYRIANSKPLRTGQRVVSLPTSRPVIRIDGRLHVEMVDGGEMVLLPSDEDGPLHLEVTSGRMLLAPANEAGAVTTSLKIGGVTSLLTLTDSTSLLALEVGRVDGPIRDPLTDPAQTTARIWAVSGNFSVAIAGGVETALESPGMVDLMPGLDDVPLPNEAPEWVHTDLTGRLPRYASGVLNRVFEFEKPADLILRENAYHRRTEIRDLARQCLSWIEDFEPVVAVLDDPERYVEWPELIDLLRDAVRRGPRTAQAVRESMVTVYGDRSEELYELLWKFDAKELSAEASKRLVQYLDDKALACRVLSFNNLNRITKLGYYYRPEKSEFERRASVKRWAAWADRRPGAAPPKPAEAVPAAAPDKPATDP